MLYFAISFILIISGIILLLYSLLSEAQAGSQGYSTDYSLKNYSSEEVYSSREDLDDLPVPEFFVEDISAHNNEDELFQHRDKVPARNDELKGYHDELPGNISREIDNLFEMNEDEILPDDAIRPDDEILDVDDFPEADFGTETISDQAVYAAGCEPSDVALYIDSSDIVDYENSRGVIDPSLEGYRSISRVGRGSLLYEKDGMNFRMGRKLYRFDFYRIEEVWPGENYLSFVLKDGKAVNLFVFGRDNELISEIDAKYREYKKLTA